MNDFKVLHPEELEGVTGGERREALVFSLYAEGFAQILWQGHEILLCPLLQVHRFDCRLLSNFCVNSSPHTDYNHF